MPAKNPCLRPGTSKQRKARRPGYCAPSPKRWGLPAWSLCAWALLCRLPQRELLLLRLLRLGFAQGPSLLRRLTEEPVCTLEKAVRALKHEAHLYTGFVRFSEYQGALSAVITPKNQVLPLLASHFVQALPR